MTTLARALCACLFAAAAAVPASAAPRLRWELADIEVYGSDKVKPEDIRARFGDDLRHMLNRWGVTSKAAKAEAEAMRASIEDRVRRQWGLGWTHLDVIELSRSEKGVVQGLLSFDMVDTEHMAERFVYRPAPKKEVADASGLLEQWTAYAAAARTSALTSGGDLKRTVCPAFYCPEGTGTPEMNAFEERFHEGVPGYKQLFVQILREDASPENRVRALYLLTYLPDANDVTALVSSGLTDADASVREAAVTILNDIAVHRVDVLFPVRDVVKLLDYPSAQDRQHGLAMMLSISANKDYRSIVFGPAADQVLRLLRQKHPGVRQMALTLLTVLSGEKHGADEYEAWDKWLWRARQAATKQGTKD